MSKSIPQKKVSQKKKPVVRVQKANGKTVLSYRVPQCVEHYLMASLNPFDSPAGACLPADLFPLPSRKLKLFARGTFSTGTTGFGFISATQSWANDRLLGIATTAASAGGTGTDVSTFTNRTLIYSNSPYAAGSLVGFSARSVTTGIRVRCTASNMNRGGTYVGLELPHSFDTGALSYTEVATHPLASLEGVPSSSTGEWEFDVCNSGPTGTPELAYVDAQLNHGPYGGLDLNPFIIYVQTPTPGVSFDFEITSHVELIGANLADVTPSHASPQGFSKAVEAMKDYTTSHGPVGASAIPSVLERFANGIRDELPNLMTIGQGAFKALYGDPSGLAQMAAGGLSLITQEMSHKAVDSPARLLDHRKKSVFTLPLIEEI